MMDSKKSLESKKKALSWILDFAQADLDNLSEERRRNILFEISSFMIVPDGMRQWYKTFGYMDTVKQILLEHPDSEISKSMESRNGLLDFKKLKRIKGKLNEVLMGITESENTGEPGRWKIIHLPKVSPILYKKDGIVRVIDFPTRFNNFEDRVILGFASLLHHLPTDSVKKCGGCERYFAHLSRRKRIYCSPNCTWKALAHKRRENLKNHPRKYQAYLKKQREIMRRKYEEKRRAEFGPNVKIKRRKEG